MEEKNLKQTNQRYLLESYDNAVCSYAYAWLFYFPFMLGTVHEQNPGRTFSRTVLCSSHSLYDECQETLGEVHNLSPFGSERCV